MVARCDICQIRHSDTKRKRLSSKQIIRKNHARTARFLARSARFLARSARLLARSARFLARSRRFLARSRRFGEVFLMTDLSKGKYAVLNYLFGA